MLEYASFRRHPDRIYGGECGECDNIFIHWRLEVVKDSVLLRFNEEDWYKAEMNISRHLREAQEKYDKYKETAKPPEREQMPWIPYFSDAYLLPKIPGGSPDEEINLPWFSTVDQNLFHHDMHGFDAEINLNAVVPSAETVEIWKRSAVDLALNNVDTPGKFRPDQQRERLIAAYEILQEGRTIDLLAIFKVPEPANLKTMVVEQLRGDLPSQTYPVRKFLLFPLGPIIVFPFLLLWAVYSFIYPVWPAIYVLSAIYAPIVFYYWIRSGRPQIWTWLTTFWMTRWIFACRRRRHAKPKSRDVWGPAGPVRSNGIRDSFDEEKGLGLQRPKTVRLGRDWKA
jgi:hypothetical protein